MQTWTWRTCAALAMAALWLPPGHAVSADAGIEAEAPARTVAGAQEFLHQILPGNRYVSTPMTEMLARARSENLRAAFDSLPLVFDAAPVADCVSYLLADASSTWLVLRNPQDAGDVSEASVETLLGDAVIGDPDGLHFGSIRALRQSGAEVHIRFAGNRDDAVLHLDAVATAERVHAAFDFLRLHCDASRATGF